MAERLSLSHSPSALSHGFVRSGIESLGTNKNIVLIGRYDRLPNIQFVLVCTRVIDLLYYVAVNYITFGLKTINYNWHMFGENK